MNDKFKMSSEDNIFYAKRNIVDSIYSESRLEGIGVTYPETMEIYEGRAVAGLTIEETIKVNNLKHAWHFILDNLDYPLDLRFIRQINSEIGRGIVLDTGNIRMPDVKIGGTHWRPEIPDEEEAERFFSRISDYGESSVTEKAIDVMLYIMRSQLFMDGNKRTAQLAANKVMICGGAGVICIPVEKQKEFLELLIKYYESGAKEAIANFIYDNCIDGI